MHNASKRMSGVFKPVIIKRIFYIILKLFPTIKLLTTVATEKDFGTSCRQFYLADCHQDL